MPGPAELSALEAARASGLVAEGRPLLVMLSGGADSVCLLDVARGLGADVSALHVNYGLRGPESEADEQHCCGLCARLGVPLAVERVTLPDEGNLQAAARDARYALAERHAAGDYAAAHTASDQAETVLYRLAVSPGRRALLGMEPRRGRLVRPLLAASRADTRAWCEHRGLAWREDASNSDPRFARARVRADVMSALTELNPAAERNVAETARHLRDESEVLDAAVGELLAGSRTVEAGRLEEAGPALARLALRRLAELASGGRRSLSQAEAGSILALARDRHGSRALDLGEGLRALAEYGTVRFVLGPDAPAPDPVALQVPGSAEFGDWVVEARLGASGEAVFSAAALGPSLLVRPWREGDRMRPAGLGGSKTLSDLFTDLKVPRALRATLPVVEAGGEIAWVAGVASGEAFTARAGDPPAHLSARRMGA